MPDLFTMVIAGYVAANAHKWLADLRDTLLNKGKEVATEKGKAWLDDKEQQRHLELVLKKAVQGGLKKFRQRKDRDQYRDILTNLFEPGEHNAALRREAITFFTLSDKPDLDELNEIYDRSLRTRNLSQTILPVNAAPYLASFFEALIDELYADGCFRSQISDVIRTRAAMLMAEVNTSLREIHKTLKNEYTDEQFQQDLTKYIDHLEHAMHNLKIVGFLPKEQKRDPEIRSIFVPLRIALSDYSTSNEQSNSIVGLLEQHPYMVMLGDPGSGKSTAIRYLAWSHARVNQSSTELTDVPLLPNHPLPLRIELRLLLHERKLNPEYSFLSYATEVLLGRNHVHVNPLMFERLLQQKRMMVLFDGLDEVTTLDERKRLVEEIEHFVQLYPGNHILVTSRPVGYDLASCSDHLFTHSKVQNFDDDQIQQFLERWYTHVLGLSPLQYDDQQELDMLFKTLKENQRLHKLAENPLLLTVITGLYRSQRLPEKRVQVYDRCAELLLETWAKLKGTDERWTDMKLGKEDQFACVAHLGFQLHERSQEEDDAQKDDGSEADTATDVSERVMQREIEHFIRDQKLITEIAEQRKEARRFLDLMRIEAGLIVERGTDENEESVYGFVHRTFQEYFAASDIHHRYLEEDRTLIVTFLEEHLHDPHWQEVILLLLGKLGRKQVTAHLRQILNGTITSRRSSYRDILQQDLFFVCKCLLEEMPVEVDLADDVLSRLSNLIITSPFSLQCSIALSMVGRLTQTKQFSNANLGLRALTNLAASEAIIDVHLKINIVAILYENSAVASTERQQAIQMLLKFAQYSSLSPSDTIYTAQTLYSISPQGSEERQWAVQFLLQFIQRFDTSIKYAVQAAETLYRFSPPDSEEERQTINGLLSLIQSTKLSTRYIVQIAEMFYYSKQSPSVGRQLAAQFLLQFAQSPDLSVEDLLQVFTAFGNFGPSESEENQQAIHILLQLVQDSNLSVEYIIKVARALYLCSPQDSQEKQQAIQVLLTLAQRSDISVQDTLQAIETLYYFNIMYRQTYTAKKLRQIATQHLLQLARRPGLSVEHTIRVTEELYRRSPQGSQEEKRAGKALLELAQRSDLSIEHVIQAAEALYRSSDRNSEGQQRAFQLLWQLAQDERTTANQRLRIFTIPVVTWGVSYRDKAQAIQALQRLLTKEELVGYLEKRWIIVHTRVSAEEIPYVAALAQQQWLSPKICNDMYDTLSRSVSEFHKISILGDPISD
jgi:hypothetical protein